MHPVLFQLGSLTVSTYSVLFTLGSLAAIVLSVRLARLTGMNRSHVLYIAFCAVIGGSVAAAAPGLLLSMSGSVPGPWAGRWTQFGMAGAFLAGAIAARVNGVSLPKAFDVCASGAALSHGIGRIGCFAAGCCWGTPFNGPWAVTFQDPALHKHIGIPIGIGLHPTQAYEAITEILLAALAYRMMLRPHRDGQVMATYLVLTSAVRFALEFVRAHPRQEFAGLLSLAQWMAILTAGLGLALFANLHVSTTRSWDSNSA